MRAKMSILSVLLGLTVFGCSTNQTGKYVPIGGGLMVVNTQTGAILVPRQGEWRQITPAIPEPQIIPIEDAKFDKK